MPLNGEYEPSTSDWARENAELYMASGGAEGAELKGKPVILLTTIGAKTGEKRAVPLAYQVIDGRLVIVASMAGAQRNPPWFFNLVKHPEVEVELNGESFKATAVVTEGEDRSYLYGKVAEVLPAFQEYATRTTRVIPVVELKRIG